MRILFLSTTAQSGGAAIAASRLAQALRRHGVEVSMAVRTRRAPFLWERARIWVANGFRRRGLWSVDTASAGEDVTRLAAFRQADVIHLHWVNQGFLSLCQLRRIRESGKPVVWTMHDMWPCTGICHHARECTAFHAHCHDCPQLLRPGGRDLSWRTFRSKQAAYALTASAPRPVAFVGCSRWLTDQARQSALLGGHRLLQIPNTYPADLFHPASQAEARRRMGLPAEGRLLLFACQKVTNARKGLDYLLRALRHPVLAPWRGRLRLVVVGQMAGSVAAQVPFPVHALGYLHGDADMATLYQAVDLFVTPSLEENLPNTIMEAMATGTPCVGFRVGGIPEMITHEADGYLARYRDGDDLARGIAYVLDPARHDRLAAAAAAKAAELWGEDTVARRYTSLYQELL